MAGELRCRLLEAGRAALLAGAVDAGSIVFIERRHVIRRRRQRPAAWAGARWLLVAFWCTVSAGATVRVPWCCTRRCASQRKPRRTTLATACRELGFVECKQDGAHGHRLAGAGSATYADDDVSTSAILGVHGMSASDRGDYPRAIDLLQRSIEAAIRCGDCRQQAWSLSILGRAHLLPWRLLTAPKWPSHRLHRIGQHERWLAFLPWPQALWPSSIYYTRRLRPDNLALEQSWTLACQLGDPCWEAMTARMLGRVSARNGDLPSAMTWLEEALRRCGSVTDQYQWVTRDRTRFDDRRRLRDPATSDRAVSAPRDPHHSRGTL